MRGHYGKAKKSVLNVPPNLQPLLPFRLLNAISKALKKIEKSVAHDRSSSIFGFIAGSELKHLPDRFIAASSWRTKARKFFLHAVHIVMLYFRLAPLLAAPLSYHSEKDRKEVERAMLIFCTAREID